jgi:hypothetical protein
VRIGDFKKLSFFLVGHFGFGFFKKKYFCLIPMEISQTKWLSRMGQNFDDYPGFQPKITQPKHFSPQYMYLHRKQEGSERPQPPDFADIEKRTYAEVDNILDRSGLSNCWTDCST